MENLWSSLLILLYASFWVVTLVIIVYLIIKRIKNKGKEGFEERDN